MSIRNIWVLNDDGVPLYAKMSKDIKEDPVLVSGFIYAISAFAKSIIGDEIKSIRLKKHTFYVKKCGKIIVAILSDVDEEERIEKILTKLTEELSDVFKHKGRTFTFNDSGSAIIKKIGKILKSTR